MNSDQLRELAEWHDERADSCVYEHERRRHQETATYLRQCAEQEPVAWGQRSPDGVIRDCIGPDSHAIYEGQCTIPLYAAPQPAIGEQPEPSAEQIEAAAYERAAQECKKRLGVVSMFASSYNCHLYNAAVHDCIAAIRALKGEQK